MNIWINFDWQGNFYFVPFTKKKFELLRITFTILYRNAKAIRGRSVNDGSWRCIVVTKSLLVGRATKPPSDIENTLCVTSVAGRRERERRRGESRLLAPSREGAPGCSALCVRYWTDSIFAFFLPLCPFLSLSAPSRSCFSSYLLALPSLLPPLLLLLFHCPLADEEGPWSVEDPIHIPSTPTFLSYNADDCSVLLAISIPCCRR